MLFRPAKFAAVYNITLFFSNSAAEYIQIDFLDFRGVSTSFKKPKAVIAVYEARAQPEDHEVRDETFSSHTLH